MWELIVWQYMNPCYVVEAYKMGLYCVTYAYDLTYAQNCACIRVCLTSNLLLFVSMSINKGRKLILQKL